MTENERTEFVGLIAALAETFGRPASQGTFQGYWIGLRDLDLEDVGKAVARAVRTCDFMPPPAKLRGFVGALDGTPEDRAQIAIAVVSRAISKVGAYCSVDFRDPLINATVRALGGWTYVCEMSEQEFQSYFRARFIKQYAAYARYGVSEEATAPLIGISDRHNGVAGFGQKPPVLIASETGQSNATTLTVVQ